MADPSFDDRASGLKGESLIEHIDLSRSGSAGRIFRLVGAAVLILLALTMLIAGLLGRAARREAVALGEAVARQAAVRDADRGGADLFAGPGLGDELAAIAAHLPPETRLASAARDESGALTLTIDSADPDALRQALRADPWFAAFRERSQSVGEDGAIRVTFERAP